MGNYFTLLDVNFIVNTFIVSSVFINQVREQEIGWNTGGILRDNGELSLCAWNAKWIYYQSFWKSLEKKIYSFRNKSFILFLLTNRLA